MGVGLLLIEGSRIGMLLILGGLFHHSACFETINNLLFDERGTRSGSPRTQYAHTATSAALLRRDCGRRPRFY